MSNTKAPTQAPHPAKASPAPSSLLQRTCACGNHTPGGGECAECKRQKLQRKPLMINTPGDQYEQEADRVADMVTRSESLRGESARGVSFAALPTVSRFAGGDGAPGGTAPPIVQDVLNSPGQALDAGTRAMLEPRFGHDFGGVRVHTDGRAAESARAVNARAYTVGNNVVFGAGQYAPASAEGWRLIAHELTHVVQQGKGLRRYRNRGAFNFGKLDDAVLKEDSFNARTDKETKPWIKLITVELTSLRTDANGDIYSSGTATAQYYDNPVKLPNLSYTVGGGSRTLGKTDSGTFTVWRLEGVGYNSGLFSGQPDPAKREGPGKRYSKDLKANMSFAIFYNKGEALHVGPLAFSSHGCVHVDWTIKQLNYHSVIGLTRVRVKYLPTQAPP